MGWTIEKRLAGAQAVKALKQGACQANVAFSKLSGIDPSDVHVLRHFTLPSRLPIMVRSPPHAAVSWYGKMPSKSYGASKKKVKQNGSTGIAIDAQGRMYVSDYDLMTICSVG